MRAGAGGIDDKAADHAAKSHSLVVCSPSHSSVRAFRAKSLRWSSCEEVVPKGAGRLGLGRRHFRETHVGVCLTLRRVYMTKKARSTWRAVRTRSSHACVFWGLSRRPSRAMPQAGKSHRTGVGRFTGRHFVFLFCRGFGEKVWSVFQRWVRREWVFRDEYHGWVFGDESYSWVFGDDSHWWVP